MSSLNKVVEPIVAKVQMLDRLATDAAHARSIFARPDCVEGLPFLHTYPKNSCEVASILLSLALQEKYGHVVKVAKAYNAQQNEWHFWVEVNQVVVDVTAHQFSEHPGPLVCMRPSPLEAKFPDIQRLSPAQAYELFPTLNSERATAVISALVGSGVDSR